MQQHTARDADFVQVQAHCEVIRVTLCSKPIEGSCCSSDEHLQRLLTWTHSKTPWLLPTLLREALLGQCDSQNQSQTPVRAATLNSGCRQQQCLVLFSYMRHSARACNPPTRHCGHALAKLQQRSVHLHTPLAALLHPLKELLPDHALLASHALQHVLDACTT